mgnify:CR=1 FL=1
MDIKYSPAIVKYFKKIKDKQLKERYKMAIDLIVSDYTVGSLKSGDLAGIYSYDIYYNKTNYELAYTLKICLLYTSDAADD